MLPYVTRAARVTAGEGRLVAVAVAAVAAKDESIQRSEVGAPVDNANLEGALALSNDA